MALDPNFLRRLLEEKMVARRQRLRVWSLAALCVLVLLGTFYVLYVRAPSGFPARTVISIEGKSALNDIAHTLAARKIIKSPFWFRAAVVVLSGERSVMAGDYFFSKATGVFDVAYRLTHGGYGLTPARVTFPEGVTASRMAMILDNQLVDFDAAEFIKLAKPFEGYLFPDTYDFLPNAKAKDVVAVLRNNFEQRMKGIASPLKAFGKPVKDVVVMASILEAEARTTETRRTIAGILWKRLSLGMPLQVDAPFQYTIGKNTFQLTTEDLQYDSPYNTYLHKGLPPTAIGNPGLDALTAAVTPIKSSYFFYLSDVRGTMHYAVTHDEHVANKERYLR